ncbi:thiopeptide-type bacteriocin biosynthesis protein [Lactobacillus crispatus]|uniref:Lantibiotic dehydratase n=1 Tax=Lactobacillus crispatus TaxID=47770 RepID=A0A7H9EA43_9LACO|nr:thiopeptide-type bacteriocin biosynthesis protein [Lactobacillus crispatus]QLL74563.1 hypothetical protein GTO85_09500 [Lactobacillus crispatus]
MHPKLLNQYIIRTSNFLDDKIINDIVASDLIITPNYEKMINKVSKDTKFMEALLIASPTLYRSIFNFSHLSTKKRKSVIRSLLEYMKRAVNRVTPFGLFSSVCIIKENTVQNKSNQCPKLNITLKRHIRLSPNWLLRLYDDVIKNINKAPYQRISISPTFIAQQAYYANYILGENSVFNDGECIRYKKNGLLSVIVTKILEQPGISFLDLITYLKLKVDNVDLYNMVSVIKQLLIERLLVTDLYPNKGMSIQEFEDYIHTLNKSYPKFDKMTQIRQIVKLGRKYEDQGGIFNYQSLSDCLFDLYDEKDAIIVDTETVNSENYQVVFSDNQKMQLQDLTHLLFKLSNLMPTTDKMALENYKNKFVEKYGYLTNVPLLQVFDDNFGIGSPFAKMKFSKRQLAIQRKFIQYLINEQKKSYLKHGYWDLSEMRLSEDVFSKIEKKYSDISVDLNFKYYCKNSLVNKLILGKSPSSFWGYGFSERFSYFLNISNKSIHTQNNLCSIQYVPANKKVANIFYSKTFKNKKLLVNGFYELNDSKLSISLSDVLMSVNQNNEFEFCDLAGNIIRFDQQCMANTELESDIIKFLVSTSSPGYYIPELVGLINNLNNMKNETIKYKEIIISPKHWNIPVDLMKNILANPEKLDVFFKQVGIPRTFYLIRSDQAIPLCLSSTQDVDILANYCSHTNEKVITFEEKCLCQDGDTSGELTLTFNYDHSENINKVSSSKISKNNNIRYPNNWVYIKLYLPKSEENYFLTNNIDDFVKKHNIKNWFFIRYKDSKNHIRFRFEITNNQSIIDLLNWAQDLKSKDVISSYDIAPYMRELERYGDAKIYKTVEKIFNLDSKKSLLLLNSSNYRDALILLDLKNILINLDISSDIILNVLKNNMLKDKKIKRRFNKVKEQIGVLQQQKYSAINVYNTEISSLIRVVLVKSF